MTRQISSLASNKIFTIFSLKISTCPRAGEDIEEKVCFIGGMDRKPAARMLIC